jgi:hypothetical protein
MNCQPHICIRNPKKESMSTKVLEKSKAVDLKTIHLVKGVFTPSEATDILNGLIDEKINFHKIQRLQRWEGNHNSDTKDLNNRISELENEREKIMNYILEMKVAGKSIKIEGNLEFSAINL